MSYVAFGGPFDIVCTDPNAIKDPSGAVGCVCKVGYTCTSTLPSGICAGQCLAVAKGTEFPSLAAKVCVEAGLFWEEATQMCLDPRVPRPPTDRGGATSSAPPTRVPGPLPSSPVTDPAPPVLQQPASTGLGIAVGAGVALGLIGLVLLLAPRPA